MDATDSRKEVLEGANEGHEAHKCRLGTGDVSSARIGRCQAREAVTLTGPANRRSKNPWLKGTSPSMIADGSSEAQEEKERETDCANVCARGGLSASGPPFATFLGRAKPRPSGKECTTHDAPYGACRHTFRITEVRELGRDAAFSGSRIKDALGVCEAGDTQPSSTAPSGLSVRCTTAN